MSIIFAITLSAHVMLGIIGVIASFAVTLNLLKQGGSVKTRAVAAWIAALSYILSWLSGGYYYVFYYGSNVKPIIKEGDFPWAHFVFMEFKEHAFLFLPFATLALALAVTRVTEVKNPHLLPSVKLLAILITVIATAVTLSGILVSGAAR